MLKITDITPITWETWTHGLGEFPCWACRFKEATKFVHYSNDGKIPSDSKIPVCEKCAEFAAANPEWLNEMLMMRRMESVATHLIDVSNPVYEPCPEEPISPEEYKDMHDENGILRGAE